MSHRPPPRFRLALRAGVILSLGLCASALWSVPALAQTGGGLLSGALTGRSSGLTLRQDEPDEVDAAPARAPLVTAIEFGGIERVDDKAVRNQIRLAKGERLDPAVVAADVQRLFKMGLFDDVRVGIKPSDDGGVIVRYELLERPSVSKVRLEGAEQVSDEEILKVIDVRVNDLYSAADATRNASKIKDLYIEEGYFLATVQSHVEVKASNQVELVFRVTERAEIKVRSIEILGNDGVSDADIKGVLRTREGNVLSFMGKDGNFKREQLDYDVQVIQYLYLTRGYIQAKVDDPEVSLSPDMRYVRVTVRVHEGPQFSVGAVRIDGDSVVPVEDLRKKLKLKPDETFNYANVQADVQALASAQKEFGYAFATVSNESVPAAGERIVDWVYHIQKGKKVYFGTIEMQGAATTRDKVIRRELLIIEGELYKQSTLDGSVARVRRLGFFESVEIKTRPTPNPQVVNVVVEVKERTTGTFQVGAGFSSVDNFITTAQISKDNFLGRGQRISLQASLSAIRTMFQASFYEPYFLDTNVTFATELYSYETLYTDFARSSTGGSLSWGYRFLNDLMHIDFTYNLEHVATEIGGLTGRRDVPIASLFNKGLTSSVRATLTLDNRDDRFMPTDGWFASLTGEWARPELGSQNIFSRYTGRLRRYFPLPLESVLRFNLVGGIVTAPEGQTVPLFERFFIGGIYTIRGFQRNTLGPAIGVPTSDDPGSGLSPFNIGGSKQIYLNTEIEIPLLQAPVNLRGLLFFDIGNAFGDEEAIALESMRMSLGWGVRWLSPVGPLRFEWGVPIAPKKGEEPLVFAFTIGNSF